MAKQPRILAFAGSARKESYNKRLIRIAVRAAHRQAVLGRERRRRGGGRGGTLRGGQSSYQLGERLAGVTLGKHEVCLPFFLFLL
jgi:hypothetical protein